MTAQAAEQQPQPASGDRREDDSAAAAAALAAVWVLLSEALLAALAAAVWDALKSAAGPAMALRRLRRRYTALLGEARSRSAHILAVHLTAALDHLRADLAAAFPDTPPNIPGGVLRHILPGLQHHLQSAQLAAVRDLEDTYRRAVGSLTAPARGITETQRLADAQRILDDLSGRGFTGFIDRAGRRWELAAYVEMATRTAVSRALLNQQLTAFTTLGHDVVLVVHRTLEAPCPLCRPYEGKLLSVSGVSVGRTVSATPPDGHRKSVRVAASLPDAMAAGLLHPNCRHALVPFVDGQPVSETGRAPLPPQVYEAEQRQRLLERRVRAARRLETAALPGRKAAAARARAAAVRAARDHAAAHRIRRKPRRERIGVAR